MKVFDTSDRVKRIAERVNSTSSADFVKRLLDQRRQYVVNDDGSFSTHGLAYRDDGKGNAVVYPTVQSVGEGVHAFDDDMAYDRAVYRGDTLNMKTPDAKLFTENYKQAYPMYFQPDLLPNGSGELAYDVQAPEVRGLVPFMYDPSRGTVEEAAVVLGLDPVKDAARRIMAVENSKTNPNGGWNAREGRWYPHKSVEGGADTIAYGIKLSNGTPEAKLALSQGYLTDEQAENFVDTLAQKYYDAAKRVYDGKYGDGEWDKLSDKSQSILVDYSYNPGLQKFPSLMEGFHSGDMDMIRKNYKRYSGGKELGRNKKLLEEIDTLENEYPIFRRNGGPIRIKPENRGKFTALKKRTGHSASWFKAHGTPAQKKMAVFALNARKWKHGDGGFVNTFEDGGEDERAPWWKLPVRVPNMTGTATAAATGLRDIPLTDSTVGRELAVAGTALASPFVVDSPWLGRSAVNWLSNPSNQIIAAKVALPMIAGSAVNEGVKLATPYNSWGEGLYAPFRYVSDKVDSRFGFKTPDFLHRAGEFTLDLTNPGFVLTPYAGEIMRNIGKGAKDLYNWGKFVSGNSKEYSDALRRMRLLQDETDDKTRVVNQLHGSFNKDPGHYVLPVQGETIDIASGATPGFQTETWLDFTPYQGAETMKILQRVEDIGEAGTGSKLTYPVAAMPLNAKQMGSTEAVFRGRPDLFSQQEMFEDALGRSWPYPHELTASQEYIFNGDVAVSDEVLKYTGGSGASIPIQKGIKLGGSNIRKSMQHTESLMGDKGFVSGSTQMYANELLSGVPKDTEIVTTEENLSDVLKSLNISSPTKINDFAYEGYSPKLPNKGKVDIQVIEHDANGNANGALAWSYFKTMHPDEYHQLVNEYAIGSRSASTSQVPFKDLPIINPATNRPYTPSELYAEINSGDYKLQQVINDALGMNKNVRDQWFGDAKDNLLKHNRPLALLTNRNPEVKAAVRRALDTNARAELGSGYVHGTQYFPNIDFTDVAENEAFLRSFKINPNGIADDPEMMRNIFDAWFLPESTQLRVVSGMRGKDNIMKALFGGNHSYGGGDAAGAGLNTLEGGVSGTAFTKPQVGFMQNLPSYAEMREDILTPMGAKKIVGRINRKNALSSEEQRALTKELNSIIDDMTARNAPSNVINTLNSIKRSMGTTQSLVRFDDHLRNIGSWMPDPYAEEIIDRWTRVIDLPGIKTSGYSGTYYGKLRSGNPKATSVKFVDVNGKNAGKNPFEVGRNLRTYAKTSSSGDSYVGPGVYRAISQDQIPEESRRLAEAISEVHGKVPMTAKELEELGASYHENPITDAFRTELQGLKDRAWEYKVLGEKLEKMENMPLAKKAVRKAQEEAGLKRNTYFGDYIESYVPQRVKRELIETAPEGIKMNNISKIQKGDDGSFAIEAIDQHTGVIMKFDVFKDNNGKWVWSDADLPFAAGGFLNRMSTVYRNDKQAMMDAILRIKNKRKN